MQVITATAAASSNVAVKSRSGVKSPVILVIGRRQEDDDRVGDETNAAPAKRATRSSCG